MAAKAFSSSTFPPSMRPYTIQWSPAYSTPVHILVRCSIGLVCLFLNPTYLLKMRRAAAHWEERSCAGSEPTSMRFWTVHSRYAAASVRMTAPVSSDISVLRPSKRGWAGLNGFSICFMMACAKSYRTALQHNRCERV